MTTVPASHAQVTPAVAEPRITFERALPRLAVLYARGLLVPFLGAGMSVDACPGWDALVGRLERAAGGTEATREARGQDGRARAATEEVDRDGASGGSDDLVRRANRAIRLLSRRGPDQLTEVLRNALYDRDTMRPFPPAQTQALAKLWWPLVLSTNYDDLFASAYVEARQAEAHARRGLGEPYGASELEVLGRNQADCQRVLAALDATGTSVLWALHGFLPRRQAAAGPAFGASLGLAAETVVGHEEYRRIAHASTHYRRTFAEVARRRSFLFVGAGLRDVYLLDLFAEVQELYGPGPHPHFALVQRGETDVDFLRTRFNIVAIEYDRHSELPEMLDRLGETVQAPTAQPQRWSYRVVAPNTENVLEVTSDELPKGLVAGEAVAVSAGFWADTGRGGGKPYISSGVRAATQILRPSFPAAIDAFTLRPVGRFLHEEADTTAGRPGPIVAVTSWADTKRRDLRTIGEAATDAFDWAVHNGHRQLHMTLLAAGRSRHFAARYSLAEIVRAFGRWSREPRDRGVPLKLTVHAFPRSVAFELASGRMDIVELLTCDDVRFWIEVAEADGRVEREPAFYPAETALVDVAAALGLAAEAWTPAVEPTPTPGHGAPQWDATLRDIGVLPGATLRFTRSGTRAR